MQQMIMLIVELLRAVKAETAAIGISNEDFGEVISSFGTVITILLYSSI
jgi:hypothetical protein